MTNWINKSAKKELVFLTALFGNPTTLNTSIGGNAVWNQDTLSKTTLFGQSICFSEYELRDESVLDKFPVHHFDNQYASVAVSIDAQTLDKVLSLSSTIMYDGKLLTVRSSDVYSSIAIMYLAMRVLENPKRLKDLQDKKMEARLLKSLYSHEGNANNQHVKLIYMGLSRLAKDYLQIPSSTVPEGLLSKIKKINSQHKVNAKLHKVQKDETEDVLSEQVWEPQYESDEEDPEVSHAQSLKEAASFTKHSSKSKGAQNKFNSANIKISRHQEDLAVSQTEPLQSRFSNDIGLNLGELYKASTYRDVQIQSVEPMKTRRTDSDISLDLGGLYKQSQMRDADISSIEPLQSRAVPFGTESSHSKSGPENFDTSPYFGDRTSPHELQSTGAREAFCGRRDYDADIPPCYVNEDYPPNKLCSHSPVYGDKIEVYNTGLLPAGRTDGTCFYGRRTENPYIDAQSYLREVEDHYHEPQYQNNIY